ncbi:Fe-S cluster assembly protein SufB, partial [Candidatus Microgenomates bacterium]|nr:Fe-S cluster assembly protein SufB [Candidatus Microgenomates bacterium]
TYYLSSTQKKAKSWKDLPQKIKETYDKIGVPEAEKKMLAGVEAQYDSDAIYGSIKKKLEDQGVLFTDTDNALKKYPEIFKEYFGKLVPAMDNKFAALNTACWSGGSFVYVPKGVKVELPLQAYFRINARQIGQFERTLIVADEGSFVKYVEGCSAPIYSTDSLHAAVVEIFVKKNASVSYTTIQNWSENVYNLVTKRSKVEQNGRMSWVDCNLGSKVTMKYPSCYLMGEGASGEMLSLAVANKNQHQDTGAKMYHLAPKTTSQIISKSISLGGGKNSFRGVVEISKDSTGCKSKTKCEALVLNSGSAAESYPTFKADCPDAQISHEATISRIEEDQLFYLQSRGLTVAQAESLIVNGFAGTVIKQLPMEYAIELNRLIQLEMEGSVG